MILVVHKVEYAGNQMSYTPAVNLLGPNSSRPHAQYVVSQNILKLYEFS
jgi:hypothetical protein